jgi:hypothetical protein
MRMRTLIAAVVAALLTGAAADGLYIVTAASSAATPALPGSDTKKSGRNATEFAGHAREGAAHKHYITEPVSGKPLR